MWTLQKRSERNRLSLLWRGGCNAYCFGLNSRARGKHLAIQLLWASARLCHTCASGGGFHYTWKRLFQDVIDGYVGKCEFPIKAVLDWILWVAIFDFCYIKFVFRISGGIKFWYPVEDSDTGCLNSIAVRMEYLLLVVYIRLLGQF